MLAEGLQWLATPAPLADRLNGTLSDAVGLWSRGRRQARAWAPHRARTQAAILAAIDRLERRRAAVIIGSGPLGDVPIDTLRQRFDRVILVDLVHLATTRLSALVGRWRNVSFVRENVAGALDAKGSIITPPLALLDRIADLDYVASVNCLSQIGLGLADRYDVDPAEGADPRIARLLAAHVDRLARAPAATLVTDTAYRRLDAKERLLKRVDLLHGIPLPTPRGAWSWPVAPLGESEPDASYMHEVVVVDWSGTV